MLQDFVLVDFKMHCFQIGNWNSGECVYKIWRCAKHMYFMEEFEDEKELCTSKNGSVLLQPIKICLLLN
jgi:hypothetical protein